ncbi:CHAT domain-containing protein [Scytonema sp. UIC 10036]|uniref:CHAT domain-containing protein n=1 Tax=Scytonema sp. UIC 10036 TaxID=2304196 RepID=UPI0012DA5F5C|nr:CHAT domain-containing protein [Scytonema sp. UIC 10036]MUG92183.1 CHAT domain-containing protein [Scytonema sp. UIC 10036]
MARKRSILFYTVQLTLKQIFLRKLRQKFLSIFLASLTFLLSLIASPVVAEISSKQTSFLLSQASNASILEQQGKKYYETGRFAEAAEVWQKAADAYGKDEDGKNRTLIYKAKALQSLGLYPEACSQLLKTFTGLNLTCEKLINNQSTSLIFLNFLEKPPEYSSNKVIGLRLIGELLQRLGKLNLSQKVLEKSLQASENYPQEKGAILLSLGNIERTQGNKKRNQLNYEQQIIKSLRNKCDIFDINSKQELNQRNNENCDINDLKLYKQAFKHYQQAFNYYHKAANTQIPITQIQAELNQLSLLVDMKEWWAEQISRSKVDWPELQQELNKRVNNLLSQIPSRLSNLPQSRETIREVVYAYINFTNSLIRLKSNLREDYLLQQITELLSEAVPQIHSLIQQANSLGEQGDKQAQVEALNHLARLYESQISDAETLTEQDKNYLALAKKLTDQALGLYDNTNIDNRQILYHQRHVLGRILRASGDIKGALASYAEAWNILESLRADLVTNADNQFSFRQNVEPVYREFIELLLQHKDSEVDFKKLVLLKNITGVYNPAEGESQKESLNNPLKIARLVMESLQLAELDNFFQEPCSPSLEKLVQLEEIGEDAGEDVAVIYPIILKNSLEILLFRKNQLSYHHSHPKLPEETVKKTLENLAELIYNKTPDRVRSAFERAQRDEKLDDNKKEILSLSQNVYNWLIRPLEEKHQLNKKQTLVFVLDRPFQKIPIAALHDGDRYLIQNYNIVVSLGQQLKKPKKLKPENIQILAAGVSKAVTVKGVPFKALENVKQELENIQKLKVRVLPTILCDRKTLCEGEFTKNNFQAKMKSSPNVVHLATHGVFSSNREQTFILTGDTGDNSISIDNFQNLLNPEGKTRNRNVELLVLSACETASGDERSALGIAGVAMRSGASTTIATLWPVSDVATAMLMAEFYKNLTSPNLNEHMTRAQALRKAQLFLIEKDEYNHPLYWAPFILVGNWL